MGDGLWRRTPINRGNVPSFHENLPMFLIEAWEYLSYKQGEMGARKREDITIQVLLV